MSCPKPQPVTGHGCIYLWIDEAGQFHRLNIARAADQQAQAEEPRK